MWDILKLEKTRVRLSPGDFPLSALKDNISYFKISDLKDLTSVRPGLTGYTRTLRKWGYWRSPVLPWPKVFDEDSELSFDFADWREKALPIWRASHLIKLVQKGEAEHERYWALPGKVEYSSSSPQGAVRQIPGFSESIFPRHLRDSSIKSNLEFIWHGGWRSIDHYCPREKSRMLTKALLAQIINWGLRVVPQEMSYQPHFDSFAVDVHQGILSLEQVCWLTLRDLASSLSGVRFCEYSKCNRQINRKRRSDARTCDNSRCRKGASRERERRKLDG